MVHDPLSIIQSADPELRTEIASSHALALGEGGALSVKHKLLIALALDTAMHSEGGVRSLALQALEAGATKAEIMETNPAWPKRIR